MRRSCASPRGRWSLLAAALLLASPAFADWQITDGAQAHPAYHGPVPKKADVVFSSRGTKPEAIGVAKSFGATRVEWVYSTDQAFVADLVREIGWFGGALNAIPKLPDDDGAAKDFDGKPLVHPRMKTWGRPWVTTTNPETQKALRTLGASYAKLGANSVQVDDPLLQAYSTQWGGDFNPSTLAGFPAFLASYPDQAALERVGLRGFRGDYRDFLRSQGIKDAGEYARRQSGLATTPFWNAYLLRTVTDHFDALRKFLDKERGGPVALSMNLTFLDRPNERNPHYALAAHADYSMAETPVDKPLELRLRALTARALGLGFVPSIKPKDTASNRVAIATAYALGGNPIVPWDVYVGNDASGQPQRWSGTPEEYGDLFRMPKNHPGLFNDREQAAVVGIAVPVDHYDEKATIALVEKLEQRRIPYTFVAMGGSDAPRAADPRRLERFRVVTAVNRDDDFSGDDRGVLRGIGTRYVRATQLDDRALDDLAPFVAVGEAASLKLYPRARVVPGQRDQLVVHLVDEARGNRPADAGCKRRIAIRQALLNREVQEVSWFGGDNRKQPLELSRGARETLVTVPSCTLWGILAVTLSN